MLSLPQNLNTMKKVLPLLLFVLLAVSGCQRGPAMYEMSQSPAAVVVNAEKFVNKTAKLSSHYTDEDWKVAVEQFVVMSKNYMETKNYMTQSELDRFTAARLKFMSAIDANGNEALAREVKEVYNSLLY